MRFRHHLWITLLLLVLSTPRITQAEAPPQDEKPLPLTSKSRFLIGGDLTGNWSNDGSPYYRALRRWYLDGSAKLTYFVRDHVGIGASLGGGYSSRIGTTFYRDGGSERASHVGVGVHAIFNWQLAPRLSFMFQPALSYLHGWLRAERDDPSFAFQFQTGGRPFLLQLGCVRTALSIPLTFHASRSVALGFGPVLWLDFIVKRVPTHGREVYERPAFVTEEPASASGPLPRRTRFQAGLFTTIVVAI